MQVKIFWFREAIQGPGLLRTTFGSSVTTQTYEKYKQNYLDRGAPANDQCHTVLPAEATGIHIGAKTYIIPGHIGDSLL